MRPAGLLRGAAEVLAKIDEGLVDAYEAPERELGNKDDPLDEAVYIILSLQTDLARFRATWLNLRRSYPTWDAVERASAPSIAAAIREGGLHRQKARTIQRLLSEVRGATGTLSLGALRNMNDSDAERLLMRLPGLSWKAARCVLLYSLGRQVFPVDGNAFRILKRTGVLSPRAVYRRRALHDALQAAVPAARRHALHVNLVVHGQRVCLPRSPRCASCSLVNICPGIGLRDRSRKHLVTPSNVRAESPSRNARQ